jgi:DNA-binding SARP family transcriptional activator
VWVEFGVLGPLEVRAGGAVVQLAGARQRALLTILLLNANEVVSVDRLVEELWPGRPPAAPAHTVQVHVSNVRKALAAAAPDAADRLETQPPGYRLRTEHGELDLDRFEALCAGAREALAGGEPARAAELLGDALALWRGPALGDVAYESFAQPAIGRLEELRLTAHEERIDADLACGRHAELVPELQAFVADHPLRERPRGQLMLALYRSGRQADALEAFQDARRELVDQLGIDPSPALQRLERAILRHEPELELAPQAATVAIAAEPRRAILLAFEDAGRVGPLSSLVEPLAGSDHRCDLILARLVAAGAELAAWSELLNGHRTLLAGSGVDARTAVFTSTDPGGDLVRLAAEQEVDLIVLDARAALVDAPSLAGAAKLVLADAACDVALAFTRDGGPASGPVVVPFGGSEHDWAALELGAWLAGAHGAPLRLLGTESDDSEGRRDASRLLAHAALAVQQLAGVPTEPLLAERGAEGIVAAAAEAGVLVAGLSDSWRRDGVGGVRAEAAQRARPPALLVRRGPRPGGLAPRENLTRYTWSLALPDPGG